MQWTQLGFEPEEPQALLRAGCWYAYKLSLPLISDGRIAVAQFLKDRDGADVWRFDATGEVLRGKVRPIEGQWSLVWNDHPRRSNPLVRFYGRRFLPGDPVCLRAANSTTMLYRVCNDLAASSLSPP